MPGWTSEGWTNPGWTDKFGLDRGWIRLYRECGLDTSCIQRWSVCCETSKIKQILPPSPHHNNNNNQVTSQPDSASLISVAAAAFRRLPALSAPLRRLLTSRVLRPLRTRAICTVARQSPRRPISPWFLRPPGTVLSARCPCARLLFPLSLVVPWLRSRRSFLRLLHCATRPSHASAGARVARDVCAFRRAAQPQGERSIHPGRAGRGRAGAAGQASVQHQSRTRALHARRTPHEAPRQPVNASR